MNDENVKLSPYGIYKELLLLDLHLQEPRTGCAARTQVVTDFMDTKRIVTGRAWVLPLETGKRFNAPIEDAQGNPLNFREDAQGNALDGTEEEPLRGRLTWPWHVAPTVQTQSGNTVVFDLAVYDGPVLAETWGRLFTNEAVEILFLGRHDAPRYSWAGSYYTPEQQHEHRILDYWQEARCELNDIKRRCEDPSFVCPSHRLFKAPPINDLLMKKTP